LSAPQISSSAFGLSSVDRSAGSRDFANACCERRSSLPLRVFVGRGKRKPLRRIAQAAQLKAGSTTR